MNTDATEVVQQARLTLVSYVLGEDHSDTLVAASTGGYVVSGGLRHDLR